MDGAAAGVGISVVACIGICIAAAAPIQNRSGDVHGHAIQIGELLHRGIIHVKPAFVIGDAVDYSPALVLPAAAEHAEFSATEGDIAEIDPAIVEFAAMIFGGAAAVMCVLVKQRLGFFDSREREVMSLDAIAVIFYRRSNQCARCARRRRRPTTEARRTRANRRDGSAVFGSAETSNIEHRTCSVETFFKERTSWMGNEEQRDREIAGGGADCRNGDEVEPALFG